MIENLNACPCIAYTIILIFSYFKWMFKKNQTGSDFCEGFSASDGTTVAHSPCLLTVWCTYLHKTGKHSWKSQGCRMQKSGCIGCIFISDWKTTCFCRFPPKNYMRKNAYLDLKKTIKSKTNVSSIWIGRINSPANYNIWNICPSLETLHESCGNMIINSIRNMVIDFILFCWTWSTQTQQIELENKSASWIDLKASLDLNPSLKGNPGCGQTREAHAISKKTCQKCSPDGLKAQRSQIHYWMRFPGLDKPMKGAFWVQNKLSSIKLTSFQLVPQCGKTSRNQDQLTLMHSYLHEYNKTLESQVL